MKKRGTYEFDVTERGTLADSAENLDRLRRLFRDAPIIDNDWGPGDEGDFDHGSWHILCHLAGGTGVLQTSEGRAWAAITYDRETKLYDATLTYREAGAATTVSLGGAVTLLGSASPCLGFVEGSSLGHVTARDMGDEETLFNGWTRDQFDQAVTSEADGGTVWEHWCTTRDLRESNEVGTSVLAAWLRLVALLGGRYVAAVARGRREHSHPKQLAALVKSGLVGEEDAIWETTPHPIPRDAEFLLYEARPMDALTAIEKLDLRAGEQRYFMFQRRIEKWSRAADVKTDLRTYA